MSRRISVKINAFKFCKPFPPISAQSRSPHCFELSIKICRAHEKKDFTDLTLICCTERFPVYKVIVCSSSKVFHRQPLLRISIAKSHLHSRETFAFPMLQLGRAADLRTLKAIATPAANGPLKITFHDSYGNL